MQFPMVDAMSALIDLVGEIGFMKNFNMALTGEGWYQAWGEPARKLHAGNVVDIPSEVKH